VTAFLFRDDVESGADGWTLDGLSTDPHRWQIVNNTDLNGAAHSRTHAWRFGYVSTLLPSLFPPAWHTLTSPAITIDPGPTFLIFYNRYDLTGRTVPVLPVGSNDTDDAYVEVRYNGGPWTPLAHYTHRDLTWRGVSFNLTAQISGPTTFQVRFNVSANVIGNSGGWWIDDVMIAERGLAPAVVLLGSTGPYEAAAGRAVGLVVQVANVGDYEASFRLDAVLPESSWGATVRGDTSAPLSGYVVRLAPDNEIAVRILIAVPSAAPVGAAYSITITAAAVGDPNVSAALPLQIYLSGIPIEVVILSGIAIAIAVLLVIVLVMRRRRRPPS